MCCGHLVAGLRFGLLSSSDVFFLDTTRRCYAVNAVCTALARLALREDGQSDVISHSFSFRVLILIDKNPFAVCIGYRHREPPWGEGLGRVVMFWKKRK